VQAVAVVEREIPAQLPPQLTNGLKPVAMHHVGLERVEEGLDVGILAGRSAAGPLGPFDTSYG